MIRVEHCAFYVSTCDAGDCDRRTTALVQSSFPDADCDGWLSVCSYHNAEMITDPPSIDIYPVGLLEAIKHRKMPGKLRREAKQIAGAVRAGNWRSAKNSLNGYLAEVSYPGLLIHRRCGSGWTRRRALSSLGRRLGADNPGVTR